MFLKLHLDESLFLALPVSIAYPNNKFLPLSCGVAISLVVALAFEPWVNFVIYLELTPTFVPKSTFAFHLCYLEVVLALDPGHSSLATSSSERPASPGTCRGQGKEPHVSANLLTLGIIRPFPSLLQETSTSLTLYNYRWKSKQKDAMG